MNNPEHHINCPAFHSFDLGETATTAPECKCVPCPECKGEGEVDVLYHERFDLGGPRFESCKFCDGIGRVLQ